MADQNTGFREQQRLSNATPWVQNLVFGFSGTLTKGDIVSVSSGQAILGATGAVIFAGVALETKVGVSGTTKILVSMAPDNVYAVYDTTARAIGASLDLSGATGAQTIAAASNNDFIVVGKSADLQWTYVMIKRAKHFLGA